MNTRSIFAGLILASAFASLPLQAAQPAAHSKQVQAENTNAQYKLGDKVPDLYRQERQSLKNWSQKGLKEPAKDSQWVQISDKYVLLQREDGKILDIQPVK